MASVLVTGSASFDTLIHVEAFPPPLPGTIFSRSCRQVVAGTAVAKALAASRLFDQTVLHCYLGEDEEGRQIRERLSRENLILCADLDPAGTERHTNVMDREGGRQSFYTHYATFEPAFDPTKVEPLVAACDAVVLNIMNYCRRVIPLARQHGKPLWIDIHDWDGRNPYHQGFIDAADWLFLSSEALEDWRGFMERQIQAGKKAVVCTHGRHGSTLLEAGGRFVDLPALGTYQRVDTNGAGDSFLVGFLFGYWGGHGLEDCQRYATVCAGLTVSSPEVIHPDLGKDFLEAEYLRHYGAPPRLP